MKSRFFILIALVTSLAGMAQFKNDNVLYTTVDPNDLCKALEKNKGYLLLDVRSKGEHDDTSSSVALNLGHFKGSQNIPVQELGTRWKELIGYKDKPVFIYCSHSQRSRRASKMLADSGFTKIYNINGGMTAFHYNSVLEKPCMSSMYETANNYSIISFNELCDKIHQAAKPFLLDVRTDSAFRHVSRDPKSNAQGIIKGSVNIPLTDLDGRIPSLAPKNQEIIVVDQYGTDATKAAVLLKKNGYEHVSVLIEGVDRILSMDSRDISCKSSLYIAPVTYQTFNSSEFGRWTKTNSDYLLVDVRTADEFTNKHKDSWRNIGHLDKAVNIPVDQLESRLSELNKDRDLVLYAFSGGPEAFRAAEILNKNGYSHLHVLTGGIFNIRWASGNVKGQEYLRDMVKDVPEINQ